MKGVVLIVVFILSVQTSCRNNTQNPVLSTKQGRTDMTDLNRYLIQKDRERIQNYIERKNLKMIESPTGLWYQVIREGEGNRFFENSIVRFDYECSLLDGTKCYSSKELGPKEVILGKSQLEPGLNEGFRLLRPGTEAIFILPPFLAYGLLGDGKMIPSRAVVVYYVNILQAK